MKDFYQFLMKKFNVKENEKFTLVVDDCGKEQYYAESYITENGFYDGNTNNKFTGNFIFKILNGKYKIIKKEDLKNCEYLYFADIFDERLFYEFGDNVYVEKVDKGLLRLCVRKSNIVDFKLTVLYRYGLLFTTEKEALLPHNVKKARNFYIKLQEEFMDGIGLNELQK